MNKSEILTRLTHRLNCAAGGIGSTIEKGKTTIHLTLAKGRETNTALCGKPLINWELIYEPEVVGANYQSNPDSCPECVLRLGDLIDKALESEGLIYKKGN